MSGIILGTEKKIVFLNVHNPTPVAQATVNVIGVFSVKKAIQEQKINKISDVIGVTSEDEIYKILQALFNAGAQEVLVYGKEVESSQYKEMFDEVKNDWFGTVTDCTDLDEIAKISKEVGSREKMLFAQVVKSEEIMNVESKVKAIGESTTALFFSKNDETLAGAVAGYAISKFPGSTLIANKLINGTIDSGMQGAEQAMLDRLNSNYNAPMKGQLGIANGVTITGDSIDYKHCEKALKFRLEEDITLFLKSKPKPNFEDLDPLKAVILLRTGQFERMGALAEGKTTVSFPEIAEIPKNDILKGKLTGVKITCYYLYGIKEIGIDLYFEV